MPVGTKTYIGDGLYAINDGHGVVVTSENGVSILNKIYLEPAVATALVDYLSQELGIINKQEWTPVSEGLPEDDDDYQLSSFEERGNGCKTGYAIGGRANGGWFCAFTGKRITANIVAWRPRPEPYEP